MRVFKTKAFDRWATGEGLIDQVLWSAVDEMKSGLPAIARVATCTRSG